MARILVTGASGLLGANLVLHAVDQGHRVIAVSRTRLVTAAGVESALVDLSQPGQARSVMQSFRPNWVVHCAGLTDVDRCECEPELAFKLNAEMAELVAHASRATGARQVHLSTDAVFDGRQGDYDEGATPAPINVYGRSKLSAEQAVIEADPGALIVRTNFFGWNARAAHGLAEWFLGELQDGRPCAGFEDVWFSPLLVNDLCGILLRLVDAGLSGIYHVPGADCVTKYDFGVRLANAFELDSSLITRASVKGARLAAPRGERLCLSSRRLTADLGLSPPGLDRGMAGLKDLRDGTYVARLRDLIRRQTS